MASVPAANGMLEEDELLTKDGSAAVASDAEPPHVPYVKGTFYLLERHDLILEETRVGLRRKGNRRVDKSALVREAIELLAAKYRVSV